MDNTEKYLSFEETCGKPLKSYFAIDGEKRNVEICTKKKAVHNSSHPLEESPTVFYNLKNVLLYPDYTRTSKSKNSLSKKHIETAKEVKEYTKKNFIEKLNLPGGYERGDATLIVKYGDKDTGKNYTLTYRINSPSS